MIGFILYIISVVFSYYVMRHCAKKEHIWDWESFFIFSKLSLIPLFNICCAMVAFLMTFGDEEPPSWL